ncbi:uncharacterized protein LOC109803811 [Cajanus cajan]|uniref:Ribonuclease H protein At1g65750 family n=1 Tax=Cajanus cajan TaxID=3821 RepID=A0A151T6B7_CAJCA|nr:uncharacterized protein LOC109803811 [Cajanus cajan]KYP62565.1 Putative ribonuclease H protein At1g65750 family [Cajanus cajan]
MFNSPKFDLYSSYPKCYEAKCDIDGLVTRNGEAYCGGILRDELGRFVMAFTTKVGRGSVLQAKLYRIWHGLRITKEQFKTSRIMVESDSMIAVNLINDGCMRSHHCFETFREVIKELVAHNQLISCSYISREANKVVDALAKSRVANGEEPIIFFNPPSLILPLLLAYSSGLLNSCS